MRKFCSHNNIILSIIAGMLIFCMAAADVSMYIKYATREVVVEESHELEKAYADGSYNGTDSDSENGEESYVSSTEGKPLFNILEIVPTEKKAVIGYTIGGCEPFDNATEFKDGDLLITAQQMREAYMDAFINKEPGSSNAKSWDYLNVNIGTINSKMAEGSYWVSRSTGERVDDKINVWELSERERNRRYEQKNGLSPFSFEPVDAKGYYLKVGSGLGVYAKGEVVNGDQVMYSKFYDYSSSRNYEYIFVYSETASSRPGSINVTNHKRIKYKNNEKFLRNVFGFNSVDEALDWKKDHVVDVTVRTPMSVSMYDIERADVIIVNNGTNMDYYSNAVEMNNIAHGIDKDTDKNVVFDSNVDFNDFTGPNGNTVSGFEKVIKIYERVAVREDVAFIGSRNCISGTTFDTNMHKLMCMLFFVGKVIDGTETPFAGRDIFMNYMKRYVDEPGTRYVDAAKPANDKDVDVRYVPLDNVTYTDLRNRYEEHKNQDDRNLYADFRAPSLRTSDYYDGRPYMHMLLPGTHVGHPLVLDPAKAIVRGYYENGTLVPYYDEQYALDNRQETLKRYDKYMFQDSGISDDDIWESTDNKGTTIYCYSGAYNSMSNATDYAYIDDNGSFHVLDKYSSDSPNGPYWFKIDYDNGINGEYTYRMINWDSADYDSWPWGDGGTYMGKWVFAKYANGNNANLHLYYDYITWGSYRPGNVPNGGQSYKNVSLEAENELFKGDSQLINKAVKGREVEREKEDPRHINETSRKDYYISMNILNGDGFNSHATPGSNNKVLYYNQYEYVNDKVKNWESANNKAYIPVNLRIKSSCKLKSIVLYANNKSTTPLVTYSFGSNGIDVGDSAIEVTGAGTYGGRKIELVPDNKVDEMGRHLLVTKNDHAPIYTYNTSLRDVLYNLYITKRNAKFVVQLNAIAPNGQTKSIEDTVTFVKRDFFMLD